jgi:hypothetical protein
MSKVVRSVGKAISKVVKGVVNTVKKVAKSKLGKIILVAAAVYFGGAALAGGFSSSAAGGSFLSGMGTGVANAASSLSTAWSSALSGNLSAAGSSLSAGFQGTTTALQAANAGALTSGMTQAQMLASQNAGISGATAATNSAAATAFPAGAGVGGGAQLALTPAQVAASKGLIGGLSPMGQYAAISGGTQLVGGAIQGYGAQKAQEEQRAYEDQKAADAKKQYNDNVGTNWWDAPGDPNQVAQAGAARYEPIAAGDPNSPFAVDSTSFTNRNKGLIGNSMPTYNRYYNA